MSRYSRCMEARTRVFVYVGFAACTAAGPEPREAPVVVESPVPMDHTPVVVETPVVTEADEPATGGCAWPAASGEVETVVARVLAQLTTPDGFHCPQAVRAVGTSEALVSYTGVDEATGDRVWVKLERVPAEGPGSLGERKASVFRLPDAAGCQIDGRLDDEWYCRRAAARTAGGAQAVVAWLTDHPEVRALDWVYTGVLPGGLEPPDLERAARVLHVVDRRGGTVCHANGDRSQCWRQPRPSRMNVGMFHVEVAATGRRAWRLEADAVHGDNGAAWPALKEPDSLLAAVSATFPDRVIRSLRDGVLVVGRYDEVGGQAAVGVEIVAEWLLLRGPTGWVSTPVPDVIVADVVQSGPSVAVIGSTFFLGETSSYERWDLLAFAPGTHGLEFVGDLVLGDLSTEDAEDGADGDDEPIVEDRRYRVTGRGSACFRLQSPGRWERALAGDWQITASGLRRGCARGA